MQDLGPLATCLAHFPEVRQVNVSNNYIGGEALLEFFKKDLPVELDLTGNPLKNGTELNLNRCRSRDISALASALIKNKTLKELALHHSNIEDITALASALKDNKALTILRLYDNKIEDLTALASALNKNKTLKELALDGNRIDDVSALEEGLKTNTSLKQLFLHNKIQDIAALASALKENKTLSWLSLKGNEIKDFQKRKLKEIWIKTRGHDKHLWI